MARLIAQRLFNSIVSIALVSVVLFLIFEISPETVAADALGQYSTREQRDLWLAANGYNEPMLVRFLDWVRRCVTGEFGKSRLYNAPVSTVLWSRVGASAILAGAFFAVLVPLSLSLGVIAGMREGSGLDRGISLLSILTTSIPPFASAVLLTAIFVFGLGMLPGAVLLLYDFGYLTRITRASMADVMQTAYIRTAVLKGLPNWWIILRHALRNALIPPFTVIMLQVNWLIGGVVVVEFFFAYKGFGSLILEASLSHDLFLLQACTAVSVLIAVGTQTIADIGYGLLNPRIRVAR